LQPFDSNNIIRNANVIIFDAKLNPTLNVTGMSNFSGINVQISNVKNLYELELACAAVANNMVKKSEKIYENLRVLIINGFEKLVVPCQLFDKRGYKIVKDTISRNFVRDIRQKQLLPKKCIENFTSSLSILQNFSKPYPV